MRALPYFSSTNASDVTCDVCAYNAPPLMISDIILDPLFFNPNVQNYKYTDVGADSTSNITSLTTLISTSDTNISNYVNAAKNSITSIINQYSVSTYDATKPWVDSVKLCADN
jgi:hypothetical protein